MGGRAGGRVEGERERRWRGGGEGVGGEGGREGGREWKDVLGSTHGGVREREARTKEKEQGQKKTILKKIIKKENKLALAPEIHRE